MRSLDQRRTAVSISSPGQFLHRRVHITRTSLTTKAYLIRCATPCIRCRRSRVEGWDATHKRTPPCRGTAVFFDEARRPCTAESDSFCRFQRASEGAARPSGRKQPERSNFSALEQICFQQTRESTDHGFFVVERRTHVDGRGAFANPRHGRGAVSEPIHSENAL